MDGPRSRRKLFLGGDLYRRGLDTHAIADQRCRFLSAVRRLPKANERLISLIDRKTTQLVNQDIARSPRARFEPSPELENRIEQWAIFCRLANPPVRKWWIFKVAMGVLFHGFFRDPDHLEGDPEDVDPWLSVPFRFADAGGPLFKKYSFLPWDPTCETAEEYINSSVSDFNKWLSRYCERVRHRFEEEGFTQLQGYRQQPRHFEWLVRYQMLGETYEQIAATADPHVEAGTVSETVHELHRLIALPPRKPRGRPRKL